MDEYEATSRYVTNPGTVFKWRIENFSLCPLKDRESLESPEFEGCDATWCLVLYPDGNNVVKAGKIGVFLKKVSSVCQQNDVSFKISLLDGEGTGHHCVSSHNVFKGNDSDWGFGNIVDRKVLLEEERNLLPDDTLTVYCEITGRAPLIHGTVTQTKKKSKPVGIISCLETLSCDFEELYTSKEYSDVTLKLKDQEFVAHKIVLAARSAVFAAMFKHDMKEKQSNVVDISDIDSPILTDMLCYIYTGKVKDLSVDKAFGLYAAADKYALEELKLICLQIIKDDLSVDNFCDIVHLAYTYNEKELKEAILVFLNNNTNKILSSDHWVSFEDREPGLTSLILRSVLLNNPKL